jgi:peptide/nickel transport system permease protein
MVITLWFLTTMLFFMFRLLPGDPTLMYIDQGLPLEVQQQVRAQFGLDKPLYQQYFIYMGNVLHGDFGRSFYYRTPVSAVLGDKLVATVMLMGTSVVLAFVLGTLGGALLAWRRGSKSELVGLIVALFLRSAPEFWTGLMALMIFSYWLGWFPIGGMNTVGQNLTSFVQQYLSVDFLHHLALPAMVAAAYYLATPLLIMRNSMLEVVGEDFVEMARAKGLSERAVMFRHAMRNALLPVVTVLTLMIGFAVGGEVLIETIFRWPGMGREMVLSVQRHDYPVAQASFFVLAVIVIAMNFLTDLMYGWLDPRITYS